MSNAHKILVVDEDSGARQNTAQTLTGEGYDVVSVSSGEDALWELGKDSYDAVFTAMAMRGRSGLDVAEEIHLGTPGLPVVVITAQAHGDDRERFEAAGVSEFLHKPFSPEQLADAARRVLQGRSAAAALHSLAPGAGAGPAKAIARPSSHLKNIVLFFLAPFVGLFYVLIFPAVGLVMLASMLLNAEAQEPLQSKQRQPAAAGESRVLKTAAMTFIAVLIGISYAIVAPLLGIGVLLWFSFQAWGKLGVKAIKA
jgi:CheY-like chemotaxis protein